MPKSKDDALIAEAERLREELLRTANRLQVFADQLLLEIRQTRDAAQDKSAQIDELGGSGAHP